MLEALSSTSNRGSSASPTDRLIDPVEELLVLKTAGRSVFVDEGQFLIGHSSACDMVVKTGPALHSKIIRQGGVTWIEAEEGSFLNVNGIARRRMALRRGDVLDIEGLRIEVDFELSDVEVRQPNLSMNDVHLKEDLSLLSAEELCDRIMAEQAMIDEFENGRRAGVEGLLDAISEVHDTGSLPVSLPIDVAKGFETAPTTLLVDSTIDCQRLLTQIRDLSAIVNDRSTELDQCESELFTAAAILADAQDRVTQQIGDLLEQLQGPISEPELRASA